MPAGALSINSGIVKVSVVCPGFIDTPILYENLGMKDRNVAFRSREAQARRSKKRARARAARER